MPSNFNNFTIVHISDLYNKMFGKEQSNILEKIEKLLENCMEICNKKYIVWQKGIGVLAKLNLWESGLENNALEYDQLEIELEMFCQDIVNEKRYHHNSFAIPKKGSGFFKFINNKIKQFT